MHWRDCAEHLFCMCAAVQTADRGQEGGGAGHAGRGRNAARWPRSLQALLLCWLPAALLHWRRTQRGLASLLSSGMPGDNDTALHGTRVQPVRVITLACARDYGPKRCAAGAFSLAVALMSFELTKKSTLCHTAHKFTQTQSVLKDNNGGGRNNGTMDDNITTLWVFNL